MFKYGGVSLAIFEDRVEISNPGNFSLDAASQRVEPGMASNPGLKGNPDTVDEALRQMIKDNPAITIPMMPEATKLSRNGVLYHLQVLKDKFGLTRVGGRTSGHWEFLK